MLSLSKTRPCPVSMQMRGLKVGTSIDAKARTGRTDSIGTRPVDPQLRVVTRHVSGFLPRTFWHLTKSVSTRGKTAEIDHLPAAMAVKDRMWWREQGIVSIDSTLSPLPLQTSPARGREVGTGPHGDGGCPPVAAGMLAGASGAGRAR